MKKIYSAACILAGAALFFAACQSKTSKHFAGIDRKNLDTTANPADDFYQFANGGWLKNNPVPETESRWGSFNEIEEHNQLALKSLLEEASKSNAAAGTNMQKAGDFYATGMDSAAIEKAGISPLQAQIEEIDGIKNVNDLMRVVAKHQTYGVGSLYSFYAYQDPRNSAAVVPQVAQGGLGLPDRDYYFSPAFENIRKEYVPHISKMFQLIGQDASAADRSAQAVMALETELAKASMTRVELRDPVKTYHKMTVDELNKISPNLNWNMCLETMGVKKADYLVVGQPDFLKKADQLVKSGSLDTWKSYLKYHLVTSFAPNLSSNFVNENFHFYATVLTGTKTLKPRWKRVVKEADNSLGEALGQVYVDKYFSADAKKRCLEMVNNLQEVFRNRIKSLDWMQDSTKQKALGKLNKFMKKIGYPDKWKDYSKLQIDRSSYAGNCLKANVFSFNYMVDKIGKPVDKTEWLMTPPTVNAYYEPSMNEIVFPAGILQSPFYNPEADDAINYGGIGAVIGHEMTHGFDDQGRQYDEDGNLKDWWTRADAEKFTSKAGKVISQFNAYNPIDTMHINGALTIGENLADLGGLSISYEAFKKTEQGKSTDKIDGFTPDQRFFLGWAQGWRNNMREAALKQRLVTDPHAPGKYRTNGPLSNMPEFYAAFNVKPENKMYRPDSLRAKVW